MLALICLGGLPIRSGKFLPCHPGVRTDIRSSYVSTMNLRGLYGAAVLEHRRVESLSERTGVLPLISEL